MEKVTRRSFLKAAGLATGTVAVVGRAGLVGTASASPADEPATVVKPTGRAPRETIVAYVRDASRGEVTVMSGASETTYRDRALVSRLLKAAQASDVAA